MLTSIVFTTTLLTIGHLDLILASPLASTNDVPTTRRSPNLTHVLAKRQWYPINQLCESPEHWVSRECVGGRLFDRAWRDECVDDMGEVDYDWGQCPHNTVCVETIHSHNDRLYQNIACITRPNKEAQKPNSTYQPPPTGQCGIQVVSGADTLLPSVRTVPIKIQKAISRAAVTSFMEGTYKISQPTVTWRFFLLIIANYEGTNGFYTVKPTNTPMVGKLRRTNQTVCLYNESNGDCIPSNNYDLLAGDFIDFRFGLGQTQVVNFYYLLLAGI